MKSVAHAWIALMALERLKSLKEKGGYIEQEFKSFYLGKSLDVYYNEQADKFTKFFDKHKDAFVQGAWFPDSVISDNLAGAHTFKMKKPEKEAEKEKAKIITNETPSHLSARRTFIDNKRLNEEIYIIEDYTLPDRCEALSHAIRDLILIQRDQPKGADIMFNDDQITLYFLMLSHYLAA